MSQVAERKPFINEDCSTVAVFLQSRANRTEQIVEHRRIHSHVAEELCLEVEDPRTTMQKKPVSLFFGNSQVSLLPNIRERATETVA